MVKPAWAIKGGNGTAGAKTAQMEEWAKSGRVRKLGNVKWRFGQGRNGKVAGAKNGGMVRKESPVWAMGRKSGKTAKPVWPQKMINLRNYYICHPSLARATLSAH